MNRISGILTLVVCCGALAVPHVAEARAGGGRSSVGSMGGHTYQSSPMPSAQPIERSAAPRPAPSMAPQPSYQQPYAQPGAGHPFLYGLAGGFLGAGLSNMLFGHGYGGGYDGYGGGSGLGFLPILLLAGLGYLIYRMFRNRSGAGFTLPLTPSVNSPFAPLANSPLATPGINTELSLSLTADDMQIFSQTLEKIQLSWGSGDVAHMRSLVTPEILGYFNEELSGNASRNLINRVTNVTVTQCNPVAAWSEAGLDYATLDMKWTAIDFMARLDRQPSDADYVASGDADHAVAAQEVWTFVRARDQGHWILSAIQQV